MKKAGFYLSLWILTACTSAQMSQVVNEAAKQMGSGSPPTATEVGDGLREALIQGTSHGADILSKTDGYFGNPKIKIPFPPDVRKVEDKLRQVGLGGEVDKFVMTLNRGAEDAAKEAKPIFVDAIRQMTIEDAWGILRGQPDAATQYLKKTTTTALHAKFKPVIQRSLDKVNATKYYGDIINQYNRIPFVDKVNPDLNEYATQMAMQGLFMMIADEEKKIRDNPAERTTELLKKVFAYQK